MVRAKSGLACLCRCYLLVAWFANFIAGETPDSEPGCTGVKYAFQGKGFEDDVPPRAISGKSSSLLSVGQCLDVMSGDKLCRTVFRAAAIIHWGISRKALFRIWDERYSEESERANSETPDVFEPWEARPVTVFAWSCDFAPPVFSRVLSPNLSSPDHANPKPPIVSLLHYCYSFAYFETAVFVGVPLPSFA